MLAKLHHKNIVGFHGLVFCAGGEPKYLVMELAKGGSLDAYLKREREAHGGVSLQQILDLTEDILNGLLYLHNYKPNPIAHRSGLEEAWRWTTSALNWAP